MLEKYTKEQILAVIEENGGTKQNLLAILLELQDLSSQNYIDERTAKIVAERLDISLVQMYDILTFYAMLETKPRGRYIVEVCNNAPCHASKSDKLAAFLEKELGVRVGETTPDGMFSLQYMPCSGNCNIGPVIRVQGKIHGDLTEEKVRQILKELQDNQ
mgnify:FL=1